MVTYYTVVVSAGETVRVKMWGKGSREWVIVGKMGGWGDTTCCLTHCNSEVGKQSGEKINAGIFNLPNLILFHHFLFYGVKCG